MNKLWEGINIPITDQANLQLPKNAYERNVFVLIAFLSLLMLATSPLWGVLETSEARYAEISREMLQSGDWMHPTLLNIHHYHKPPSTYWITATAYSMFGVNAFATRFFLVMAYGLQILLLFKIGVLLFESERVAWYAALVYATLPVVIISVRALTTDPYLTTFVMLSLYGWIKYLRTAHLSCLYLFAVALGLGFMTKGPAVFMVPVLGIACLWNWIPLPSINKRHYALALLLFLTLALWWFVVAFFRNPSLAEHYFFKHLADRLLHAEVFARRAPWYYYLYIFPVVSAPWIFIFIKGLVDKKIWKDNRHGELLKRICLGWILFPFLLFSVSSSKLVLYILPAFIGFSLLTGFFIAEGISKKMMYTVFGFYTIAYAVLLFTVLFVTSLSTQWWFALFPAAAFIISLYFLFLRKRIGQLVILWSVVFIAHLILYTSFFMQSNSLLVNATTPLTAFIKENNFVQRNIVVYDEMLPSVAFALNRPIISIYDGNRLLKRETQFEQNGDWKNLLVDRADSLTLRNLLSLKTVFILKSKKGSRVKTLPVANWQHRDFGKWILYYN